MTDAPTEPPPGPRLDAAGPVYVVDTDAVHRDQIAKALRCHGLTVDVYETPAHFLARIATLPAGCIVVGTGVAGMDHAALQHELLVRGCRFPVVAVTPEDDVPTAVRAMKAGAADVVARPVHDRDLWVAVRGALAAMNHEQVGSGEAQALRDRLARLTRRERQVLEGMVQGEANKLIAVRLGISPRTVEVHRAKVMEKLDCRSLPQIVHLAVQAGLPVA